MSGALQVARTHAKPTSFGARKGSKKGHKKGGLVKRSSFGASHAASAKPSPRENYERLRNRLAKASAQYKEGIGQAVHVAETEGSLAMSAFLAGYFGPAKLRIPGVNNRLGDYRTVVGGGAMAYGLLQAFDGSAKSMTGNHALALGQGIFGSVLYEIAHNAGVDLAVKRNPTANAGRQRLAGRDGMGRRVLTSGSYDDVGYAGDYGSAAQVGRRRLRR